MPKKFRLTAPKGKKKGKLNIPDETPRVHQSLSMSFCHENEDICVSRVSGLLINSFSQTDMQLRDYANRSTQTDDIKVSYIDGCTQTDDIKVSYIDGSTQTDHIEEEKCEDNKLIPQLDENSFAVAERTVPPSIIQFEEYGVLDEAQATDLPAYHNDCVNMEVEYQTPSRPQASMEYLQDEDDDMEEKICIGNNDEEFLPLIRKHKGIFKNVSGKTYT